MNGIVIKIDPAIFRMGDFELRWYSVAIILAVVAAVIIYLSMKVKRGITAENQVYASLKR